MKHRIRLEWKPADREKELGGKSDGPYFFKRMFLIFYSLMFITKEIRTICLHTLERKEEGKGHLGAVVTGKEAWKDLLRPLTQRL